MLTTAKVGNINPNDYRRILEDHRKVLEFAQDLIGRTVNCCYSQDALERDRRGSKHLVSDAQPKAASNPIADRIRPAGMVC